MRVYTLQENDYSDLEETLECIMHKAKKFLAKMEEGEFDVEVQTNRKTL